MFTGLLLALLASFGMVDNAALAATPDVSAVATVAAEDAVAARPGTHTAVAARARARTGTGARSLTRPLRARWSATVAPRLGRPVLRRLAGRAPPTLRSI